VSELNEELLKNEWIHVELKLLESSSSFKYHEEQTQMRINLCKEKRSMEENVIFTIPIER